MNRYLRKGDIDALIKKNKSLYYSIENLYRGSLSKKEIDLNLKVEIKNFLENARSILDYCIHDIADIYQINYSKIYFPILCGGNSNKDNFIKYINKNLPGLDLKNKPLFEYLESIQPYHETYRWLADFVNITNEHKHSRLTPQTKIEKRKRIISKHVNGGIVSWDPEFVKFGDGVWINGAYVDPKTQMPIPTSNTIIEVEIWVDFLFDNTQISVLNMLKKILDEIPKIVENIYTLL